MSARTHSASLTLLIVSSVLIAGPVARAADYTWAVSGNGARADFDNPSNWSPGGGPPGAGDTFTLLAPDLTQVVNVLQPRTVARGTVSGGNFSLLTSGEGLTITGNSPGALTFEEAAGRGTWAQLYGNVRVPSGGITLSKPPGPFRSMIIDNYGNLSADSLTINAGDFFVRDLAATLNVTHDVVVGNPASTEHPEFSSFGTTTIGGALRLQPNGGFAHPSASGPMTVTGGIFLDGGNGAAAGNVTANVTNAGIFFAAGEFFGPTNPIRNPNSPPLVLTGNFVQAPEGRLHEAVRLTNGAPLVVNGTTVDVAGLITLEPTEGSSLHVGDRYYLIDTDAPVTTTATIRALAFPQLAFAPLVVPGEGLYAVVTAVPEPSCLGLAAAAALLLRRRRA